MKFQYAYAVGVLALIGRGNTLALVSRSDANDSIDASNSTSLNKPTDFTITNCGQQEPVLRQSIEEMLEQAYFVYDSLNRRTPGLYGAFVSMFKSDKNRQLVLEYANDLWLLRPRLLPSVLYFTCVTPNFEQSSIQLIKTAWERCQTRGVSTWTPTKFFRGNQPVFVCPSLFSAPTTTERTCPQVVNNAYHWPTLPKRSQPELLLRDLVYATVKGERGNDPGHPDSYYGKAVCRTQQDSPKWSINWWGLYFLITNRCSSHPSPFEAPCNLPRNDIASSIAASNSTTDNSFNMTTTPITQPTTSNSSDDEMSIIFPPILDDEDDNDEGDSVGTSYNGTTGQTPFGHTQFGHNTNAIGGTESASS